MIIVTTNKRTGFKGRYNPDTDIAYIEQGLSTEERAKVIEHELLHSIFKRFGGSQEAIIRYICSERYTKELESLLCQ